MATSASGGSAETREAMERYAGRCPVVLLTNVEAPALGELADVVVPMHAGVERGGVACRSFQHTLAMFLDLERRLTGTQIHVPGVVLRAAEASAGLLERRHDWLPELADLLLGPDGTHIVGPARRFSSTQQSALMLREGPRLPAVGCETGDWSHVDVYLTKTTDYRMLLLAGSRWEAQLIEWTSQRGSTVVALGGEVEGATRSLRYPYDDDDDVRLLTETLVAELLAADAWSRSAG